MQSIIPALNSAVVNGTFGFVLCIGEAQIRLTGTEVLRFQSDITRIQVVSPNVICVYVK
jgi:hypothetical protein